MNNIDDLEDLENKELYETIAKSISFLEENNNGYGEHYLSMSGAEGISRKSQNCIKKYVLEPYKALVKSNNAIRIMNTSLYQKICPKEIYELEKPLLEYFEDENKCLCTLKKFINSKIDLPVASLTGVFTTTLILIHNVNLDKIDKLVAMSKNLQNSPYSLTLPDSYTKPDNHELVAEIDTTINKVLTKKIKRL